FARGWRESTTASLLSRNVFERLFYGLYGCKLGTRRVNLVIDPRFLHGSRCGLLGPYSLRREAIRKGLIERCPYIVCIFTSSSFITLQSLLLFVRALLQLHRG